MSKQRFQKNDLGVYVLPGRIIDPLPGVAQARTAEAAGFGSIWIAERWDRKEIGALCGTLGQATSKIRVVAGMTHFGSRHPVVLAGMGTTLQALTQGRFELGIARSSPQQWANLGLAAPNNAALADHASILRRLWAGETVEYKGPAGCYPRLRLGDRDPNPPPLLLAAIGPKTLELAGRHFDGVVLHPFLTPRAVQRSAAIARRGAEAAGRDPGKLRVIATVVIAHDLSHDERLMAVEARAVTYFGIPDVGDAILKCNEWDRAPADVLLNDPELKGLEFQRVPPAEFLARIRRAASIIPSSWADEAVALGSAAACAARLREYRAAGADELLLHGATAEHLGAVVDAYVASNAQPPIDY